MTDLHTLARDRRETTVADQWDEQGLRLWAMLFRGVEWEEGERCVAHSDREDVWAHEQIATALRAAHAAGRRDGLEEAARVCDEEAAQAKRHWDIYQTMLWAARNIRALAKGEGES